MGDMKENVFHVEKGQKDKNIEETEVKNFTEKPEEKKGELIIVFLVVKK